MASDFEKFNEEVEKAKKSLSEMRKEQSKLEQSITSLRDGYGKIRDINIEIARQEKLKEKALKFKTDWNNKEGKELKKLNEDLKKGLSIDKNRLKVLIAEKKARGASVKQLEEHVKLLKEGAEETKKMVKGASKSRAIWNSTKNMVPFGLNKLKSYGVFEMDKEIRNAARSMGIGNSKFQAFADNMQSAGLASQAMGVGIKELAVLQKGYSEEIGRSVMLTREGLMAMGEMVEGTGLGEQFAIGMAGAMDDFGASVGTSRDLIEETMNIADSMGVNSAKAAESMQKNLKFAQKYNFKNGVKGLAKMTSEALRLKLDLDGIAGLADKVFRPEGAIELSAQLSTMGGAFARMANPMQLMFKARNDFAGFAKDVGKATSEFVQFNKEEGTFDIMGGLAADRMRELANMLNISVEELKKMGTQQKRIQMIGSVSPINIPEKDKAMVESLAEIGKNGKITINTGKEVKDLKDLNNDDLKLLRKKEQSLDKRAKEARSALDVFEDIQKQLQGLLLPLASGLKEGMQPLQDMMMDLSKKKGFYDSIQSFAKSIGSFIADFGKSVIPTIASWVDSLGPKGMLAAVIGFKAATWIARGMSLGLGFNLTARVRGGVGGSGGGTGKIGKGSGFRSDYKTARQAGFSRRQAFKESRMLNRGSRMGGMGLGLGLGLAGMGLGMARGQMDDRNSGTGKALGIGSSALSGAGTGAMIGSMILPGIGTAIGAGLGGLAGAAYGYYNEYGSEEAQKRARARAGTQSGTAYKPSTLIPTNDGIVKFNPNDKFLNVNDAVLAASTQEGKLDKLGKRVKTEEVKHTFDDIEITININAKGMDENIAKQIVDNKSFIRGLNTKIKEEASMMLSGGILNPGPQYMTG
tara:strand:- start:4285 stop:6879 length:2595 start_codon:yes stop_codon:yes gene_type:complete